MLNEDLNFCSWIDCLGRLVKIQVLALKEVRDMVEHNIDSLTSQTALSRDQIIIRDMNIRVRNSIDIYFNGDRGTNLIEDDKRLLDFENCFLMQEEKDLLPVPVMSNTSPENSVHFLVHVILSMGEYNTEIDALCHSSFRESLQKVNLIGDQRDEMSLKQYSEKLTRKYVEEKLVYYPNSMKKNGDISGDGKRNF